MTSENWTGVFSDIDGKASPTRQFSTEEIVDAVVIGTGAGGAPLLSRLAKAGLKVVALEAGNHWSANKDFVTPLTIFVPAPIEVLVLNETQEEFFVLAELHSSFTARGPPSSV